MSYIVWEDEMNKLLNVVGQLNFFAQLADQAKELKLTGEELGCFLRRLGDDLSNVAATADERRSIGKKNRVSPAMLAQIIATVGGQRPILGSELNRITHRLRARADADEGMRQTSAAWEGVITAAIVRPITKLEEFNHKFNALKMD